uniref:Uncharacterized protein n=1 Tax=Zooxanthella nutricula TaxID=1333877 RepID=A0A7S2H8D3_9DINO
MYHFLWALQDDAHRRTNGTVDLLVGNHELELLQGHLHDLATRRHKHDANDLQSYEVLGIPRRRKALCSYAKFPERCMANPKGKHNCADSAGGQQKAEECVRRAWDRQGAMGSKARERFKVAVQVGDSAFVHAGLLFKLWEKIEHTKDKGDAVAWLNAHFASLVSGTPMQELADSKDVILNAKDAHSPVWTRVGRGLDEQAPTVFSGGKDQCELVKEGLGFLFGKAEGKRMVIGHNTILSGRPVAACQGHLIMTDTIMSRGFYEADITPGSEHQDPIEKMFDPRLSALETFDNVGAEVWSVQPVGGRQMQGGRCKHLGPGSSA